MEAMSATQRFAFDLVRRADGDMPIIAVP